MIREDGAFELYIIQHSYADNPERWSRSNLDHFGYPQGFSASDPCWQATGVTGTFDPKQAAQAVSKLNSEKHVTSGSAVTFRAARVVIMQLTTPV